jgi:RNA polymerase sigma-70 factor (ECF subfamily)
MGGSPDVAEDLMQETFLRIHHCRGSFARGKQVAPWAYAIARNCFISHVRSAKSKWAKASVVADQVELPATSSASVEEESIARQTARVVTPRAREPDPRPTRGVHPPPI